MKNKKVLKTGKNENACSGGADWTQFEEVWQYGSNNNPGDQDRDPLKEQDGVAPQCAVMGIDPLPNGVIGGRAYIPPIVTTKSFVGSHSINNYGWIINIPSSGLNSNGYVKKR